MNIRQVRENTGLSVGELASYCGISTQTVYRIEQGKPVSRIYIAQVCNALGVNIQDVDGLNIISEEKGMCEDTYESGGIFTVGGASGSYLCRSPFNTESEYMISAVVGTGWGLTAISASNPQISTLAGDGSQSIGTAFDNESNALEAQVFALPTGNFSVVPAQVWQPLGRGANIYVNVFVNVGDSLFVSVAFRRSTKHIIPQKPRAQPHTHSLPAARRETRNMLAGFAAQYPEEGKAYAHVATPTEQDTEVQSYGRGHAQANRAPLGPTTVSHRKPTQRQGR